MEIGNSIIKLSQFVFLFLLISQFQVIGDWKKIKEFSILLLFIKISDVLINAFFKIINFWPGIWHFEQSYMNSINTILFSWYGFADFGKIGMWTVLFSFPKFNLISDFLSIILVIKYFKFKSLNNNEFPLNKFIYPIFVFALNLNIGFFLSDSEISSYSTKLNIPLLTNEILSENGSTIVWNISSFYILFFAAGIISYYFYLSKRSAEINLFKYYFLSYLVFLFFIEFLKNETPYISTFTNNLNSHDKTMQNSWSGFSFSQIQSLLFGILLLFKSYKK
ncbi:hypothetical protein [Leptospira kanakyensis]|uniref:hypothetical protein n=1 Tax=Leptospira kanakyensis TaxID=2484968 RepID=UPI001083EA14|nr:hypothetical protein [Leptospira kanakyensis]TGK55743.1 hypothetical protein EHQ11_00040 [Leptospira kanakyensis]